MKSFFKIDRSSLAPLAAGIIGGTMLIAGLVQASTTISTNIVTGGTLQVGGDITLQNAETISNSTDGTIALTATTVTASNNLTVSNIASTSKAIVGGDSTNGTISGAVFGYCNLTTVTVNATSTNYAVCSSAGGVRAGDRVFVEATSSLPAGLIVDSASSTVSGTISVRINNVNAGTATATGGISLNFWALR